MTIFETAARKKFRFPSAIGPLNVEQLWDLPLIQKTGTKVDLDTVYRGINAELKSINEDSIVEQKPDPRRGNLEVQIEILKHIVAVKQKEAADALARRDREAQRSRIIEEIGKREAGEMSAKSKEELLAELKKLDG